LEGLEGRTDKGGTIGIPGDGEDSPFGVAHNSFGVVGRFLQTFTEKVDFDGTGLNAFASRHGFWRNGIREIRNEWVNWKLMPRKTRTSSLEQNQHG
jgi:hypothetical protein